MAIVAKAVLINYNILGWAHSQEKKILKSYNKIVKADISDQGPEMNLCRLSKGITYSLRTQEWFR